MSKLDATYVRKIDATESFISLFTLNNVTFDLKLTQDTNQD